MNAFTEFGLAEPILKALAEENYETPTPIQAQTIPLLLNGRDIVGIAQTGTGKTAAFALPILNRLALNPRRPERKSCRVLVLSPTRELSGQILDSVRAYSRHMRIQSTLAIGGVPMGRQIRALAHGVDVLVATPGRLLDLMNSHAVSLDRIEAFVLDEADRMLDMGFINDIRKIIARLPKERQTLLFSATMPQDIASLAQQMLRDPAQVAVTPVATTAERIAQRVIHLDRGLKAGTLADLLRNEPVNRALVFTRTKHGADKVVAGLNKIGIDAEAIHGNKSQGQRERVLANFRSGRIRTLVATDIAARGIDVDGVSHVINFDLPNVPESYVHRIGRTARAGADGAAISLVSTDELPFLRDIQRLIRMDIPASGDIPPPRPAHPNRGGQKQRSHGGGRPGGHHGRPRGERPAAAHAGKAGAERHGNERHGNERHGSERDGGAAQKPRREGHPHQRNGHHRGDDTRSPRADDGRSHHRNGAPGNGHRRPHREDRRPEASDRPRGVASTQPIGDLNKVAFMNNR